MSSEEAYDYEFNETCCTYPLEKHPHLYYTVPGIIIVIIALILNLLTVYVIAKNKNLQTISNLHILNWRICNSILLAITPFVYVVIFQIYILEATVMRVWNGVILSLQTGNAIFAITLFLDWYFLNHSQQISLKLRKHFRTEMILIWIVIVVLALCACLFYPLTTKGIWLFVVITISLLIFVVVQIMNMVKKSGSTDAGSKSSLVLYLVSSFALCWFPVYVHLGVITFNPDSNPSGEIQLLVLIIAYANSFFIFCLMYRYDEDFKSCLKKMCNCKDARSVPGKSNEEDVVDKV